MVESGAMHNFITKYVVRNIGLKLKPVHASFKAINCRNMRVIGRLILFLSDLEISREGQTLPLVKLDDYDLVLG